MWGCKEKWCIGLYDVQQKFRRIYVTEPCFFRGLHCLYGKFKRAYPGAAMKVYQNNSPIIVLYAYGSHRVTFGRIIISLSAPDFACYVKRGFMRVNSTIQALCNGSKVQIKAVSHNFPRIIGILLFNLDDLFHSANHD